MSPRKSRLPDVLLGLGYAVLIGALLVGAMAAYNQSFTKSVDVTLETGKLGNSLQTGSDVKLNGVPIGRVAKISSSEQGAKLTLALDPDVAKDISPQTVARLLPKTLFGERYVSLREAFAGDGGLANGDVIREDSSTEAVELQEVFDELLPMLQAIQPAKLSAALGEMSLMLRDQGEDLGTMMVAWSDYFKKLNPLVPEMTTNLAKFAEVANLYADAAPDLLDAVESMATTSQMLVDENDNLTALFASVITSSNDVTGWMDDNQKTIEVLSAESRKALEAVRPYADQFPCILRSATKFAPKMDTVLGKGTDEPGLHVKLSVVKSRGKYLVGKDTPTFPTQGKSKCPYVTGDPASRGSSVGDQQVAPRQTPAPPRRFAPEVLSAATGLGDANSPSENRLIAELVAPTLGMAPADYPQWSSMLLGPVLRGAKVSLR
ncbi:MCE family protein [Nocardioides sp. Bht2]|uniref:MCE family protein n=1 Tax=Nocardioides sp. Bht2 TaxID=3392297 RepID=UPI0039B392BB